MTAYRREDTPEARYRPDDGCPLFSEALEAHLVAVSRGETPSRGRFCAHCYTPVGAGSEQCPHCRTDLGGGRHTVSTVPEEISAALRAQRKIESRWVNGLAYLGLLIATVGGIVLVLTVPVLKDRLLYATIVYGVILLIGGRILAGVLGGYYGDRIGYARARERTRAFWDRWQSERARN